MGMLCCSQRIPTVVSFYLFKSGVSSLCWPIRKQKFSFALFFCLRNGVLALVSDLAIFFLTVSRVWRSNPRSFPSSKRGCIETVCWVAHGVRRLWRRKTHAQGCRYFEKRTRQTVDRWRSAMKSTCASCIFLGRPRSINTSSHNSVPVLE